MTQLKVNTCIDPLMMRYYWNNTHYFKINIFKSVLLALKTIFSCISSFFFLQSFLHISTLYSNCNRKVIEEKVYEQEMGYEKIIEVGTKPKRFVLYGLVTIFVQLTRRLDDASLEQMTEALTGEMPNTYTMTKRCSEGLVNHKAHCLPAGIFRPPIGM